MKRSLVAMSALFLTVLIHVDAVARTSCTVHRITDACKLFKDMGPKDFLEYSSGVHAPGCGLRAPKDFIRADYARTAAQGRLEALNIFKEAPDASLHPDFKKEVETNSLSVLFVLAQIERGQTSGEIRVPWPPDSPIEKKFVKSTELKDALERALGTEKFVALLAAAKKSDVSVFRDEQKLGFQGPVGFGEFRERATKLFERVQKEAVAYFLRRRKEDKLNDFEKSILARMKTLQADLPEASLLSVPCNPYQGMANIMDDHVVSIPYDNAVLPDASLLFLMAHEFAHSFDPCRSEQTLIKWGRGHRITDDEGEIGDDPTDIVGGPVPMAKSPYNKIWKYLVSIGFRRNSSSEPLKSIDDACNDEVVNEAFADWFATQVITRIIENDGVSGNVAKVKRDLKSGKKRDVAEEGRIFSVPKSWEWLLFGLDPACGEKFRGRENVIFNGHPSWMNRLNKIVLRNRKIGELMECR